MYQELSRLTDQRSRSQRYITYQHQKTAIIQTRKSCRRSNLVKIIPELSATRNAMFKVIRSNTEIEIIPRIALLHSNLVQSFITSQMFNVKFKGQGHGVEDQGHSVK